MSIEKMFFYVNKQLIFRHYKSSARLRNGDIQGSCVVAVKFTPHEMQELFKSGSKNAVSGNVSNPLPKRPKVSVLLISRQERTQSAQRMHLPESRIINGLLLSFSALCFFPLFGEERLPYSRISGRSLHS